MVSFHSDAIRTVILFPLKAISDLDTSSMGKNWDYMGFAKPFVSNCIEALFLYGIIVVLTPLFLIIAVALRRRGIRKMELRYRKNAWFAGFVMLYTKFSFSAYVALT